MQIRRRKARRIALALLAFAFCPLAGAGMADAGPKYRAAPVFDIDKRKKTAHALADWAKYGAYASVRYSGERNLRLDDRIGDFSDKYSAYLGLTARLEPSESVVAFAHLEAELARRETHRGALAIDELHRKEVVASLRLSERAAISAGRMRFSDVRRWSLDASVDGVHYGFCGEDFSLELAAFSGTRRDEGLYALAHVSRPLEGGLIGGLAIFESEGGRERLHLNGYWNARLSEALSLTVNAGATLGDAANGRSLGVAADARLIGKIGAGELNPQFTLGLAAGSIGFAETGLESRKTYDGGQTQFHRYGYLYQPDLTNIVVATAAIGLRPSRMFSADLTAHVYAQTEKTAGEQSARVNGGTSGRSRFLGGEISFVGAWRPSRRTKAELGLSLFRPGPAYENRSAARQIYARFSYYF